jgi:hypothetical protein
MDKEKKKKGILATIWESMTKTGGCCGGGEDCCGPSDENETTACQDNKDKEESCD